VFKVGYSRTFNLGNFNSERIEYEAEFDDGHDPEASFDVVRDTVMKMRQRSRAKYAREIADTHQPEGHQHPPAQT